MAPVWQLPAEQSGFSDTAGFQCAGNTQGMHSTGQVLAVGDAHGPFERGHISLPRTRPRLCRARFAAPKLWSLALVWITTGWKEPG